MSAPQTYVIFLIAGDAYALNTSAIHHLEMFEHVTPVPNTAPAVEGVVFSRGQVVPAINVRTRFGLPREPHTMRTRLIFIHAKQRVVALIVDAAREFRMINPEAIRPIGDTLMGIRGNYVVGVTNVGDRNILILDLDALLTLEEVTPPQHLQAPASAT